MSLLIGNVTGFRLKEIAEEVEKRNGILMCKSGKAWMCYKDRTPKCSCGKTLSDDEINFGDGKCMKCEKIEELQKKGELWWNVDYSS